MKNTEISGFAMGGLAVTIPDTATRRPFEPALSIVISLVTKPKPAESLVGLVYSETPKEQRTDPNEASYPWYRRTAPLAGVALVMVIILNVIF